MGPKPSKPSRIWYQSFVDPEEQRPYIECLQQHLQSYADPDIDFQVHGISPPDRYLHPLTEFRCAAQTIRNAVEAKEQGYDAFVIGHFQEPGLIECRATIDIPVIGLGEATMLYACMLGRKVGLVTINPAFIPWHEDQIVRYGLKERVIGVRAIDAQVATLVKAFDEEEAYKQVHDDFCRQVQPLLDMGVEVIIPAGGLPMLLFARERNFTVSDALVLNGIAVVAKSAEMALKLSRLTGAVVSRKGIFARAPLQAVQEFMQTR